jgi:hypothetical protein
MLPIFGVGRSANLQVRRKTVKTFIRAEGRRRRFGEGLAKGNILGEMGKEP